MGRAPAPTDLICFKSCEQFDGKSLLNLVLEKYEVDELLNMYRYPCHMIMVFPLLHNFGEPPSAMWRNIHEKNMGKGY